MDSCCKKELGSQYLMIGLMIFLFLFSLGQAFQIAALDNVVENGASSGVSLLSTPLASSGAPASKPAAAPTMVGGC
ncbi:hypothetical protein HYY69_03395 [Candidatus Woesearchaeota archaeon]|nr:hypothetical protein [Candidatus Woesearchaeota archaeon]